MTSEKNYVKKEEFDEWIKSLYTADDAFFDIPYCGKNLRFKAKFPAKLAVQLQKVNKDTQAFKMIAMLSVFPEMSIADAEKLPQDLIMKITAKFEDNLNFEEEVIKKKA